MENFIRSKRAAVRRHFLLALLPKISLTDSTNSRQTRTLNAIFKEPTPANVQWNAIEALLVAIDCQVIEGNGSRVRFEKDGVIASFHRPHPAKEAKRYQVRDARDYLIKSGVRP